MEQPKRKGRKPKEEPTPVEPPKRKAWWRRTLTTVLEIATIALEVIRLVKRK